jgi:hypothetical protein
LREQLRIVGAFPERALYRLQNAGVSVYKAKKMQKNCLELQVKRKDIQKVFAIFENVCYNRGANTSYSVQRVSAVGLARVVEFARKRWGFLLGAGLFAIGSYATDSLILGVDFSASNVYAREARATLAEYGIKPFAFYRSGSEDIISAKLLVLRDVEFCSVRREGRRVVVEMRLGKDEREEYAQGDMIAKRSGTVRSVTVLKGTPLKKAGDTVIAGESLAGAYYETESGEKTVVCVARVTLACTYETVVETSDDESAFALAYLTAIDGDCVLEKKEVSPCVGGYLVRLAYAYTQTINF